MAIETNGISQLVDLNALNTMFGALRDQLNSKVYTTTANKNEELGTLALPYSKAYITSLILAQGVTLTYDTSKGMIQSSKGLVPSTDESLNIGTSDIKFSHVYSKIVNTTSIEPIGSAADIKIGYSGKQITVDTNGGIITPHNITLNTINNSSIIFNNSVINKSVVLQQGSSGDYGTLTFKSKESGAPVAHFVSQEIDGHINGSTRDVDNQGFDASKGGTSRRIWFSDATVETRRSSDPKFYYKSSNKELHLYDTYINNTQSHIEGSLGVSTSISAATSISAGTELSAPIVSATNYVTATNYVNTSDVRTPLITMSDTASIKYNEETHGFDFIC